MSIEEARQFLRDKGFEVVERIWLVKLTKEYEIREPIIAVKVSQKHQCFDHWCRGGVHPLVSATAIKRMERVILEALVFEELEGNR